jgi:multidrug resistance efflux pump
VTSVAEVPAPIDGVVIGREANIGLNVDPSMPLFSVVDLSTVWVVADLYERILPACGREVRQGSPLPRIQDSDLRAA